MYAVLKWFTGTATNSLISQHRFSTILYTIVQNCPITKKWTCKPRNSYWLKTPNQHTTVDQPRVFKTWANHRTGNRKQTHVW